MWDAFGPTVSDNGAPYDVVFKIVNDCFTAKSTDACVKYFWKNSLAAHHWTRKEVNVWAG